MSTKDQQAFIKGLVANHRRRRPLLLAGKRALLWYAIAFPATVAMMHYVQAFRPGFVDQLAHHPLFLIEVVSALLFAPVGAYVALASSIPGERVSKRAVIGLWVLIALFGIGLVAGFTPLAPETSTVGARHACWLEVLVYGAVCLMIFGIMVRRGWVRFSWTRGILYGLAAGLVPAALMQLACMYNPSHALIFHYLPTVILITLGLAIMRLIHR